MGGTSIMKIDDNGTIRDMTPEEFAEYNAFVEKVKAEERAV